MGLCFCVLAFGPGYQTGQIQIRGSVCARKFAEDCQSRSHVKTNLGGRILPLTTTHVFDQDFTARCIRRVLSARLEARTNATQKLLDAPA